MSSLVQKKSSGSFVQEWILLTPLAVDIGNVDTSRTDRMAIVRGRQKLGWNSHGEENGIAIVNGTAFVPERKVDRR